MLCTQVHRVTAITGAHVSQSRFLHCRMHLFLANCAGVQCSLFAMYALVMIVVVVIARHKFSEDVIHTSESFQ